MQRVGSWQFVFETLMWKIALWVNKFEWVINGIPIVFNEKGNW
jgi:hypothetical protein